jgi:hypothetical protein
MPAEPHRPNARPGRKASGFVLGPPVVAGGSYGARRPRRRVPPDSVGARGCGDAVGRPRSDDLTAARRGVARALQARPAAPRAVGGVPRTRCAGEPRTLTPHGSGDWAGVPAALSGDDRVSHQFDTTPRRRPEDRERAPAAATLRAGAAAASGARADSVLLSLDPDEAVRKNILCYRYWPNTSYLGLRRTWMAGR